MPIELIYFGVVFAVVLLMFTVLKRPIYEAMLLAFVVLVAITGKWTSVPGYIFSAMKSTTLYAVIAFLVLSDILTRTKVIDHCIAIILSIFGRISGGAGYAAIIGSSFMGSLSGSGPGNVATTGVFTIPAMKKTGFPAHLAACVEMSASTMGNMIPPAGMIAIAFGCLDALYPGMYTMSQYWILLWGIALWFILQRVLTLMAMCGYYKVKPMDKAELPRLSDTLKKGWKGLLLPVIIFAPFLLDSLLGDFFDRRVGAAAAGNFSSSILLFVPALIAAYALLIAEKGIVKGPGDIVEDIRLSMIKVVPTSVLVLFAYFISNLFDSINVGEAIEGFITSLNINIVVLMFLIPLFTAIIGMFLPGTSQITLFGSAIISVVASAGGNPLLAAGMLPCICGAMAGMTPPVSLVMYTAMGIAGSGLKETTLNCLIWVGIHYLLSVVLLLGFLPVLGL